MIGQGGGGSLTWLEVPIESKSGRSTNLSLSLSLSLCSSALLHKSFLIFKFVISFDCCYSANLLKNAKSRFHFSVMWPCLSIFLHHSQLRQRHETGERMMIKFGSTSHPRIKRIKQRCRTLLRPRTVAPLYWFFKWGLIGSDPPDPRTKYLRF